jgi:membrane-bound lytic murein transglycosylase D
MNIARTVSLILPCLLALGCSGSKALTSSIDIHRRGYAPIIIAEPIRIESGTAPMEPRGGDNERRDGEGSARTSIDQRAQENAGGGRTSTVSQMEQGRFGGNMSREKSDSGVSKSSVARREAVDQAGQLSLLVSQDDAEEEDLSSLLAADSLQQFHIPAVFNDAVQYFVRYFTTEKRKIFANWLRHSRRYVPMIKEILREQGLPEDLIYLAMIESGFNPKAYSSMKACGPWQFMYETGGRYGLKVNHWVDERRDPEKSTVAAALYLKDLFNQFGNWYLAAAGYNAGEKRIEKAVEKHETTDFWEISKYNTLPRETRDYIPRLLAAAIIAKEPEKFGFTNISYDQPIRYTNARVPGGTSLATIARAALTDLVTLKGLNPEILTGITPPDTDDYGLKLPEFVRKERFREELRAAAEKDRRVRDVTTYVCKRRDKLASILKRFSVTQDDLFLVNSCDQEMSVKQGQIVYIPRYYKLTDQDEPQPVQIVRATRKAKETEKAGEFADEKTVKKPAGSKAVADESSRREYHIVKKDESLAGVSEMHGVNLGRLKEKNSIKKSQTYPDVRLELTSHVKRGGKPPVKAALYHVVKKGETLSGIADKYDVDMHTLKTMNRLKKNNVRYGTRLKVSSAKPRPATQG